MERTDKPFTEALPELMAERDMGYRELSRRTPGINDAGGTVSHFVKGYMHPTYETLERLAHALEVPPDYFPEHRLESIRREIDWHVPRSGSTADRKAAVKRALRSARRLGLKV